MRRSVFLLALAVVPAGNVMAQAPDPVATSVVIGPTAVVLIATYASDNIGALGLTAGLEKHVSPAVRVSFSASAARSQGSSGVRLCRPTPGGACRELLLPRWLSSVDISAGVRVIPKVPLRLIGGVGAARAWDFREPDNAAGRTDSPDQILRTLRFGGELARGSSRRAPRLLVTRTWLSPEPHALRHLNVISILFPR